MTGDIDLTENLDFRTLKKSQHHQFKHYGLTSLPWKNSNDNQGFKFTHDKHRNLPWAKNNDKSYISCGNDYINTTSTSTVSPLNTFSYIDTNNTTWTVNMSHYNSSSFTTHDYTSSLKSTISAIMYGNPNRVNTRKDALPWDIDSIKRDIPSLPWGNDSDINIKLETDVMDMSHEYRICYDVDLSFNDFKSLNFNLNHHNDPRVSMNHGRILSNDAEDITKFKYNLCYISEISNDDLISALFHEMLDDDNNMDFLTNLRHLRIHDAKNENENDDNETDVNHITLTELENFVITNTFTTSHTYDVGSFWETYNVINRDDDLYV